MAITCKRVVTISVMVLLAFASVRAATRRYQEREDAFRKECQTERGKLGLSANDLRAKYPTPEIRLISAACMPPGATADVAVSGRFAPGAKFFVENDSFEVVKETATGTQYRATLKAAPGIGPEDAALAVINPVTGQTARATNAVKVGARYEWTLNAANGWKVVARSQAADPCADATGNEYDVSFFRPGQSAAFEKTTARLGFLPANQRNYRFDLSAVEAAAPAGMEDFQALMQKMSDPKLTDAEREKLMAKLEAAQKDMTAAMSKLADPAYAKKVAEEQQRKEQEFGCRALEITLDAGKLTGEMNCSEKVGRRVPLTGAVATLK